MSAIRESLGGSKRGELHSIPSIMQGRALFPRGGTRSQKQIGSETLRDERVSLLYYYRWPTELQLIALLSFKGPTSVIAATNPSGVEDPH